ncbi:MAG TPA: cystathionine gamma-synthase family protein [Rickettsiales bacterium]|nr:cystathionine gamma-synthase family protein [Rickettsiales bacterium]
MSNSNYRKKTIGEHKLHPETQMMSYGYDPFLSEGAVKPPVFLTSTFVFRSAEDGANFFDVTSGRKPQPENTSAGLIYSRFNHPNLEIIEDRLALLDNSEAAVVTSSGMSAISAVLLAFLRPGDIVLQSNPLYGGTETLINKALKEWGISTHAIKDALSPASMREALEEAAKAGPVKIVYIETPANPTNSLVDMAGLKAELDAFEKKHGYRPISVCDNTLLGPVFQKPTEHGIDLCVYSLTKYVGGHSDLVAGGVTGKRTLITKIRLTRSAFGSQLDPHSCWMISRSMETLVLRMKQSARTASRIAAWLAANPHQKIEVFHSEHIKDPTYQAVYQKQCSGPGSTFSFVLDGGRERAFKFINALRLFKSAVSLGGTESLVCHPASTTHSGVGAEMLKLTRVSEGLIRVSIGLEHEDDLIADLEQALKNC